jgi:hypothetical protein
MPNQIERKKGTNDRDFTQVYNNMNQFMGVSGESKWISADTITGTTGTITTLSSTTGTIDTLSTIPVSFSASAATFASAANLVFPENILTLANGSGNNDVAIGNGVYYLISGPTATYGITGFAGGTNGRTITIRGFPAFNCTIYNNSAASSAGNKIRTGTGADVVSTTGFSATFLYSPTDSYWFMTSWIA